MPWIATPGASTEVETESRLGGGHPADGIQGTRDRLLAVAAELFAERGYAGASLAEMASRLGIRKPSLYNHIESKEALFIELLDHSLEAWREASGPELGVGVEGGGSGGGHRRRLRDHLRGIMDFADESPHAMALCRLAVSQLSGDLEQRAGERLLAQRVDYQARLESFFASARRAGEVGTFDPRLMALSWLTFIDGLLTHQLFSTGGRADLYRERLEELWQLFWRGLAAEAGR